MRTIIAGPRTLTDAGLIARAVEASGFVVTTVISGHARGIDRLGERWAKTQGIPVELYPANWDALDLAAGSVRNREMVAVAEALIAIWDGVSTGTKDCIDAARAAGLKVFVYMVSDAH